MYILYTEYYSIYRVCIHMYIEYVYTEYVYLEYAYIKYSTAFTMVISFALMRDRGKD